MANTAGILQQAAALALLLRAYIPPRGTALTKRPQVAVWFFRGFAVFTAMMLYAGLTQVSLEPKSGVALQTFAIGMLIAYVAGELGLFVETRIWRQTGPSEV